MRILLSFVLLVIVSGCARQGPPLQPTATEPTQATETTEPADEIHKIDQPTEDLMQLSRTLPAAERDDFRRQMTNVFDRYSTILPILIGPEPGGAFRQQLSIVNTTRDQLSSASENLSLQPTVDTGLRAVLNALSGVYRDQFYENADLATALDALRSRVDELDAAAQGPTHRLVAAQVVAQSAGVIKQMSASLLQRSGTTVPTTNTTTTTPVASR
jgi:hypothetical protein